MQNQYFWLLIFTVVIFCFMVLAIYMSRRDNQIAGEYGDVIDLLNKPNYNWTKIDMPSESWIEITHFPAPENILLWFYKDDVMWLGMSAKVDGVIVYSMAKELYFEGNILTSDCEFNDQTPTHWAIVPPKPPTN